MRVLIAGAHGKTARRLTRMLVEEGHEVRGLVRKEEQTGEVEADGAEPVLVDLEAEEVEGGIGEAVEGCDAIVFAAGAVLVLLTSWGWEGDALAPSFPSRSAGGEPSTAPARCASSGRSCCRSRAPTSPRCS